MRNSNFARIRLNPLSGKILHHDCVSMVFPRFTFLVENSVICCYQVTELRCSRYCITSASSARCPCHLGSQAYFAMSVFLGSEYKYCSSLIWRNMRNSSWIRAKQQPSARNCTSGLPGSLSRCEVVCGGG